MVATLTKTEDSLGTEKTDSLPDGFTPNPKHWTSAEQLERMKDALIEHAVAINEGGGGGGTTLVLIVPDTPGAGSTPVGNTPAGSIELLYVSSPAGEPASYSEPYWLRLENTDVGFSEFVVVIGRDSATRTLAAPTQFTHNAGPSTTYHYAGPAVAAGSGSVSPEVFARAAVLPRLPAFTAALKTKLDGIPADAAAVTIEAIATALATNASVPELSLNGAKIKNLDGPADGQDAANKNYADAVGASVAGAAETYADAAIAAAALLAPITETGATRNMSDADHGRTVLGTNGSGITVTVPTGLTPGCTVEYVSPTNAVIVAGGGMTLRHSATFYPETADNWSSLVVTIMPNGTDALVRGDLLPV